MIDSFDRKDPGFDVSGNIARLAELLRIAAETTRLLAASAGSREPVIRTLASQVDDVADALAVVGLVDFDGKDSRPLL